MSERHHQQAMGPDRRNPAPSGPTTALGEESPALERGTEEPAQLEFRLLEEPSCLAFVDTLGKRHWKKPIERLANGEALSRWLVAAGLLVEPVAVGPAALIAACGLREAIHRLLAAPRQGAGLAKEDLRTLNQWAARPGLVPQLEEPDGRPTVTWVPEGDLVAALVRVAREAVVLLGSARLAQVKKCEHPDCSLLFLDESQARRRRWCSMDTCGNRVKVGAYYRRRAPRVAPAAGRDGA